MSIFNPPADWFHAPTGAEKTWIGLALVWCLVMSIAMPYWHYKGEGKTQTSAGEAYKVSVADFVARTKRFVEEHKVGESANFLPIVKPKPGGHAYLIGATESLGQSWKWYPILKLRKDMPYTLHVSSDRYQHGLSVTSKDIGVMNFHILPTYDHVIKVTPTKAGLYDIICNEFCGAGHHEMLGQIIVEE